MYAILLLLRIMKGVGKMNKMKSICGHGKCKLHQLSKFEPSLFGETISKNACAMFHVKWDE
jgi:hypothetical protein